MQRHEIVKKAMRVGIPVSTTSPYNVLTSFEPEQEDVIILSILEATDAYLDKRLVEEIDFLDYTQQEIETEKE